jgi:putative flippase GtrA
MFKQELVLQVARFALVGGTVTATFMGLNKFLGPRLGKNRAFLAAYPPAVALHFCLNKWWTFGNRGSTTATEASHYLELTLVAFVIQWGAFQLLTRFTRMRPWLASGAATAAQMVISFVVLRVWIFAAGTAAQ